MTLLIKSLFSTYNKPSFTNKKPSSYSVSSILHNYKKNPLFVYRQTKQICNTIQSLFNQIPQNPQYNINQLKKLLTNIHLSNFSSWKILRQTSISINSILNQNLNQSHNHQPLTFNNLISLCQVLYMLNYDLGKVSDQNFIRILLSSHFYQDAIEAKQQQDLKTLLIFSKHSALFSLFQKQKQTLQHNIFNKITTQNYPTKDSQNLLSNLIKNGMYQSFWDDQFLNTLMSEIKQNHIKKDKYKSLLNALKLNDKSSQQKQKDEWTVKDTSRNDTASTNIVTQQKIFNILKQMDYNVSIDNCIFEYEVDYRIGQKYIVEYHGVHHYKTNTNTPIETMRSNWKVQCLRSKGYKVFVVPFYDWNQIETIYDKKKWLITNMEKSLFLI